MQEREDRLHHGRVQRAGLRLPGAHEHAAGERRGERDESILAPNGGGR